MPKKVRFFFFQKKLPSALIQWNLVNIITAYVFLIRYYNGKHKSYLSEFINGIYNLSKNLSVNQNFDSYDTAVKSVELCIQEVIGIIIFIFHLRICNNYCNNSNLFNTICFSTKCSKVFKKVLSY